MTFRWWERWGPAAGVVSTAFFLASIFLLTNLGTGSSDEKILAHYAKHSNQVRDIVVFFLFVVAIFFLLAFLASLRERLMVAEGEPGRLTALAYGTGVAAAVLLMVSFVFFTAAGFSELDTKKFTLDPNTYRIINNMGYAIFVSGIMIAALLLFATSAVALRTGLLFPRWFALVGVIAGVTLFAAIFFVPIFILWGWVLVASVLLLWRPAMARPSALP